MSDTRMVGILIFDEVEVLDFCGPFEVFSVAGRREGRALFQAVTIAEHERPVICRGGLSVNPHHSLDSAPRLDVLVVPGGYGTRREMDNRPLLQWLSERAAAAETVLSICTGALLLGRAGLLDECDATTHHGALELLREVAPRARVHDQRRLLDNGPLIVAAGVAAGIDAALYLVARYHGWDCAAEAAHYMEYDWEPAGIRAALGDATEPA